MTDAQIATLLVGSAAITAAIVVGLAFLFVGLFGPWGIVPFLALCLAALWLLVYLLEART